ncbi:MAG: ACP S-malonyltransferase [Spirochaetota bacterium]
MSNRKTCFLFPGQGAQAPGMARDLWEHSEEVRRLFDEAGRICERDMKALLFEATEEELGKTDNTQISLALADLAAAVVCREHNVEPAGCAGFSLGEYPALHTAGVLTTDALFHIVRIRGELMERYSREYDDEKGPAGLLAVIGLTLEECRRILEELAEAGAFLANHSAPKQLVIAGSGTGLAEAERRFDEAGAMRIVKLKVSGPFHSPLLETARRDFEKALTEFHFEDPVLPYYANVTGQRVGTGGEARDLCGKQLVSTVQWVGCEQSIDADGYDRILEVGPGKVLSGLWRGYRRGEPACLQAGTVEKIAELAG